MPRSSGAPAGYCPPLRDDRVLTFHPQCVDQAELEKFDGVSQGKYTIGLGQTKMSFCDDREGKAIVHTVARRV